MAKYLCGCNIDFIQPNSFLRETNLFRTSAGQVRYYKHSSGEKNEKGKAIEGFGSE
jgi:hypothetical protein